MYKILQSKNYAVYLEGRNTLIEVDKNGLETIISIESFYNSDAPNMAKGHLISTLRQCNSLQEFAVMVTPLFGGNIVLDQGLVCIFFGYIPVIVEKANAYIPPLYEKFSYSEEAVKACDFLNLLIP